MFEYKILLPFNINTIEQLLTDLSSPFIKLNVDNIDDDALD